MDYLYNDSESEMEIYWDQQSSGRSSSGGSVKMKALMLEVNFPIQANSDSPLLRNVEDRGTGYNYGQKWSYLNGNNQYFKKIFNV